jgi:CubicO group peptidase (beta-lactamase class C family)
MRTVHRDGADNFKMGLSWRIEQLLGIEIVWSGGASYGSRSFSGFDPKSRVGVVVLSNYNSGYGIDDIGRHLLNPKALVDSGSLVKPQERTAVTLAPEFLDKYAPLSFLRERNLDSTARRHALLHQETERARIRSLSRRGFRQGQR